jgi:lysyl-tRNA synthetase class 2
MSWEPTASLDTLRLRARILSKIRAFFSDRDLLEVETPSLSQYGVTDAHIQAFSTQFDNRDRTNYYLQTSPEYAMKRLLAAGSGSIFQISKAFRNGECGHQHNPEFTMLEWYRIDFTHHQLMQEVSDIIELTLGMPPAKHLSYKDAFLKHAGINPHSASAQDLLDVLPHHNITLSFDGNNIDKDTALHLVMSHLIEPQLGADTPEFIYDFPASQAALAQIRQDTPPVAERFELYIDGIELANGFHELTDPVEQQQRFERDQHYRQSQGYSSMDIDHRFIQALQHGLPKCSGVALGIDRLLMLACEKKHIHEVISFPWERA